MPAVGTYTLPAPVVNRLRLPATARLLPMDKSALLVVRLTSPPLVAEFRFKPSVSVRVKSPAPVKVRFKSLKLAFHVRAAEASRRVIFANPAARVKSRSVSNTSLALIVKPADCEIPATGITTLPVPVVFKLKLPAIAGSLLKIKSALVVVKLALPPVVAEVRVKALLSVNAKSPPPVKDRTRSLKLVVQLRAEDALRREIVALVAVRLISLSVSNKSLAFIDKAPGVLIPARGIITLPVPVVFKLKLPLTAGPLARVKSAFVVVKLASPPVVAEVKFRPSASVNVKAPVPVRDIIKSLKLVVQLRAEAALRRVIFAAPAARVKSRSVSKRSLALIVKPAG